MPFIRIKCECGKAYKLKPKMAGRVIACKECYASITVPDVQFDEEELAAEAAAAKAEKAKSAPAESIESLADESGEKKRREMPIPLFLAIAFATLLNGCSALNYSGDLLVGFNTGFKLDKKTLGEELLQEIEEEGLGHQIDALLEDLESYLRWVWLPMLFRIGLTIGFGAMLAWKRFGWTWVIRLTIPAIIFGMWPGEQSFLRILFDVGMAAGIWYMMKNLSPTVWPSFRPQPKEAD